METKYTYYENIVKDIINNSELNKLFVNAVAHKLNKDSKVDSNFQNYSDDINIETLKEHSDRSLWTFFFIMNLNKFQVLENVIEKGFNYNVLTNDIIKYQELKESFVYLIFLSIYLHDFGKLNPYFQKKIRFGTDNKYMSVSNFDKENEKTNKYSTFFNTEEFKKWLNIYEDFNNDIFQEKKDFHSAYNFLLKIIECFFNDKIKIVKSKRNEENFILLIILFFEKNIIPKHHSGPYFKEEDFKNHKYINKFCLFNDFVFITELLFDFIAMSDIVATTFFGNKLFIDENNKKLSPEKELIELKIFIENRFNENKLNKEELNNFEITLDYNKEIYKDLEENSINDKMDLNEIKTALGRKVAITTKESNNKINILKAPTGAGKTNLSYIHINEQLKKETFECNRIIFINPLNALNYQVKETAEEAFGIENKNFINILNSETKFDHEFSEEPNIKNLGNFEKYNYPFIVTSHVNFFDKLYSKNKKDKHTLFYLINSLLVIDEIQLHRDSLSLLNYKYLELLEKYLNVNTLIISATIPVAKELNSETGFGENWVKNKFLIEEEYSNKIMKHNIFDRTTYSLEFFNETDNLKLLQNVINRNKESNSFLITHNSLKKCNKFYNDIKNKMEKQKESEENKYKIFFYNSTILPCNQENILNNIKKSLDKKEKIILIATSKIETGIDISFDTGIRFSTSVQDIVQNAGRINRYGKGKKEKHILYIVSDEIKSKGTKEILLKITADNSNNLEFYKKFFKENEIADIENFYKIALANEKEEIGEKWRETMKDNLKLLLDTKNYSFEQLSKIKMIEKQNFETYNIFINDDLENITLNTTDKMFLKELKIKETKEIFNYLYNIEETEKTIIEFDKMKTEDKNKYKINKKRYLQLSNIIKKISFNVYIYKYDKKNDFLNEFEEIKFFRNLSKYTNNKQNEGEQYFLYSFEKYFGLINSNTHLNPVNSFLVINKKSSKDKILNEDKYYSYEYGFMQYISIDEEDYLNKEAEKYIL